MLARQYSSFDELLAAYDKDQNTFKKVKMRLVPVYKKVKIDQTNYSIQFKPKDLMEEDGVYGYMDERHYQNNLLNDYLNDLQEK